MAVILAGGGGTRMKSRLPKVLQPAAGRPLLGHVAAALAPLDLGQRLVVTSSRIEEIREAMAAEGFRDLSYAVQETPAGTADAVRVALASTAERAETVLVVQGASPLLRTETLARLLDAHLAGSAAATVLTAQVDEASGYGRVLRSGDGVTRIVEERDASDEERLVTEVNAGVYAFDLAALETALEKVGSDNSQAEYYLPDVIGLLRAAGLDVRTASADPEEVIGVKSRAHLARAAKILRRRICERWMSEGVTVLDPDVTYIDASVVIGHDATIHPWSYLEGNTTVAEGAEIGPQTRIVDSTIGPKAAVTFSVVVGAEVGPEASVGPFASLRPGTRLLEGARAGSFVELKNAVVGERAKVNHLSYVGDARLGRGVNIGAGTVTCNWDGQKKHETVIEDDAYIGSDTMLVAPVTVGRRAATAAGTVVTEDVPDDALAVGAPARVLEGRGDRMRRRGRTEPRQ